MRLRSLAPTLLAAAAFAQVTPQRLQQQAQAYFDNGRFNGAVLVARDGKPILNQGYGMANFEWNIPVTPDTRFRLGSITKQFTAMAVMLLEQDGKLKTSDPVCKFIDPCPAAWQPVTLHHLLTHTAGIPNFTSFPDYQKTMALPSPPAATIARFRDRPLDFAPGEKMSYSNSGYLLLGAVIEKVSGQSYEAFVRTRIFQPLGMRDTGYDHPAEVLPRRASGYEHSGRKLENASFIDMTIPHAAGALYSTTLDLLKWDQALSAGKLLTPEQYQRYFTAEKNNYAYGWNVVTRDGFEQQMHGGGINGFATMIMRAPAQHLLVVTLSNVLPSQAGRLAQDLLQLAAGNDVAIPARLTEIQLPVETLRKYTGEYQLAPNFILTVRLDGNQLISQATGQPEVPIFARSENTFFLKVVDAEITFEQDASGRVTGLTLLQNGRKMPATRR